LRNSIDVIACLIKVQRQLEQDADSMFSVKDRNLKMYRYKLVMREGFRYTEAFIGLQAGSDHQ